MAKWLSKDSEDSEDNAIRDQIVAILSKFTTEMEGYAYYGSNPGIKEDDYEDIGDAILDVFNLQRK